MSKLEKYIHIILDDYIIVMKKNQHNRILIAMYLKHYSVQKEYS